MWLPLSANLIAVCCSFSGSIILSDISKIVLPVIVISLRIDSNLFSFANEDIGIHVFPDLTISNNWALMLGFLLCMLLLICWGDQWLELCGGDKEGCVGHLFPFTPLQVMMIGVYHVVINILIDLLSHIGTELYN